MICLTILIGINSLQAQVFENVNVLKADSIIQANTENPNFTILDVRTPSEYEEDHLMNAHLRNFYDTDFQMQLDSLAKGRVYLIYCRSGNRSGQAFNIMQNLGFQHVYNMLGGITMWKNMGFPVTTDLPPDTDLYAEVTSTFSPAELGIKVYPNPFAKQLTIEHLKVGSHIKLFDTAGRVLFQTTASSPLFTYQLDTSSRVVILQIQHPSYEGMIIQKLIQQ